MPNSIAQEAPAYKLFKQEFLPSEDPTRIVAVLNLERGQGDVLAIVDLKIGGLIIRRIKVRRARRGSIYLNFPAVKDRESGKWTQLVEFSSTPLEDSVRQAIERAVSGVIR